MRVSTEQQKALRTIKVAIFDVDKTLVFPKDPAFYEQYSEKVERAIQMYHQVSAEKALEIAEFYRKKFGGGEQALFLGNAHEFFPELPPKPAEYSLVYDLISEIEAGGKFADQASLKKQLQHLRQEGVAVVALTNSPDDLSRRVLAESGFEPEEDFDQYISFSREGGPPKMTRRERIFLEIAEFFQALPHEVLATGDTLFTDVAPALELGMIGCHLTDQEAPNFALLVSVSVQPLIEEIIKAKQFRHLEQDISFENDKPQILAEFGTGDLVITFTVGIHGNEIYPIRGVQKVIADLKSTTLLRAGRVRFVVANVPAIQAGVRFLTTDLNRAFPGSVSGTGEALIASEVRKLVAESQFVVDLHTSVQSPPFVILSQRTPDRLALAESLGVSPIVLFESSQTPVAMIDYTTCGVGIEVGAHADYDSKQKAEDVVMTLLQKLGFLPRDVDPQVSSQASPQASQQAPVPEYFQIVDSISLEQGKKVALEHAIVDFSPLPTSVLFPGKVSQESELYPVLVDAARVYSSTYAYLAKKITRESIVGGQR